MNKKNNKQLTEIANPEQQDLFWMKKALKLAKKSANLGEVPVGAIVVKDNQMIGWGINRRETWGAPVGHAEIYALLRAAQNQANQWRLTGCTVYVTLEPCVMCSGALVNSRVDRVVFGATDPKTGGLMSLYQIGNDKRLNHQFKMTDGVLKNECADLLTKFFKTRRAENKKKKNLK